MSHRDTYLQLRGDYAEHFRQVLGVELLPVVSPVPQELDGGMHGKLLVLHIYAARLTEKQRQALVDWIVENGDTSDRSTVEANVSANKATYLIEEADLSQIVFDDPSAWG